MTDSKLIRTLKSFTEDDWNSFRRYLLMYTGEQSDNFELYDYLMSVRNAPLEDLDSNAIRKTQFPSMSHKAFLNMMSRVFKWLEEWLAVDQFKSTEDLMTLQLVKAYNKRGLFKMANAVNKKMQKSIRAQPGESLEKTKVLFETTKAQYYSDNPIKYSEGGKILEELVLHFMASQKEQAQLLISEMHNWGRLTNYNFEKLIHHLEEANAILPSTRLSTCLDELIPLVRDYDITAFNKLNQTFGNNFFDKESETHTLLGFYLISYSLQLWGRDTLKDPQVIYHLYNYGFETGLLMQSGKIPIVRFHNSVSTFGVLLSFEQTNQFIELWVEKTNTNNIESTKLLAQAQNCFHHEKYGQILDLLRNIQYENHHQKLRSDSLIIVALYEEGIEDLLQVKNYNFKRYLKRHKEAHSKYTSQLYLNFVKLLEKQTRRRYKKTKIDLKDYSPIIYKSWIDKHFKKEAEQ